MDYSKMEGKKILVCGCGSREKLVETGVLVGCDPDVGICIMPEDDLNGDPIIVWHGPMSPTMDKYLKRRYNRELGRKLFNMLFKQLQSGYLSLPELETFSSDRVPSCPFRA
jgi:hypothetical protein